MTKTVKSRHYTVILTTSDTQQTHDLPRLSGFSVFITGGYPVTIEFENDIQTESITLPPNSSYPIPVDMLDIRYKTATDYAGNASQVSIGGFKHTKDLE